MVTETPLYIASTDALDKAVGKMSRSPVVAVDLEADSMYHFTEKVCLLQMAADNSCFIIDPLALTDLSALAPLFADSAIVKIFHGADYDVRSLYRDFGFCIENLFDTELACRFLGYSHSSLEAVLKKHFNVTLDKKYQKKDWSIRPLPEEMVAYAADDVRYLADLYRNLTAALAEKKRLDWAIETCDDLCRVRSGENTESNSPLFMNIKGAGRLDPQSLAVLEKLAQFRQNAAGKKDRPPYKIMSNTALLDLAQKKPKNTDRLHQSGILSKKQCQMYGDAIIQAVRDALDIPDDALPVYPKTKKHPASPAVKRRIDALKQWRKNKAGQLEIDPAMLINNAQIQKIAGEAPGNAGDLKSVGTLKNWQLDAFGEQWIDVMAKTG